GWILFACADHTAAPSDEATSDMSAMIDGSAWTADHGTSFANFGAGSGSALVILGSRCYSCASSTATDITIDETDTLATLRWFIKTFPGRGTYILGPDPAATSALIRRSIIVGTKGGELTTTTVFLSVAGGRIDIVMFDPMAARVSGTFQFDLVDSV